MNTTQANRKWNQGYVMPTEPKELHASLRCKDCAHSTRVPNYPNRFHCNLGAPLPPLKVDTGGSCRSATPR